MKENVLSINRFENIIEKIINRAKVSHEFRKEFINNPIRVMEASSEIRLSETLNVTVEDQTDADIIYFNIPRRFHNDETLSQEELDLIVGGGSPIYNLGRAAKRLYNEYLIAMEIIHLNGGIQGGPTVTSAF